MRDECKLCGEFAPDSTPWCCDGAVMAVRRHQDREIVTLRAQLAAQEARAQMVEAALGGLLAALGDRQFKGAVLKAASDAASAALAQPAATGEGCARCGGVGARWIPSPGGVKTYDQCPTCGGTGAQPAATGEGCARCGGKGSYLGTGIYSRIEYRCGCQYARSGEERP